VAAHRTLATIHGVAILLMAFWLVSYSGTPLDDGVQSDLDHSL